MREFQKDEVWVMRIPQLQLQRFLTRRENPLEKGGDCFREMHR